MINFGGDKVANNELINSEIVILPVPFSNAANNQKLAEIAPNAILNASADMELYDIETGCEIFKKGIFTAQPVSDTSTPKKVVDAVYNQVYSYLDQGKLAVTIGGEHTVSIGAAKAYAEKFENISVLQLDACTNLKQSNNESKYDEDCVMTRIKEFAPVVHAGIRSMAKNEIQNLDKNMVFFARDLQDDTHWMNEVAERLTEKVYVTIDLSVFDPSIMPSTKKPEPGGMSWYSILNLLRTVTETSKLIGFDIAGLYPNPNNTAPDLLAARLINKLLSIKYSLKPRK